MLWNGQGNGKKAWLQVTTESVPVLLKRNKTLNTNDIMYNVHVHHSYCTCTSEHDQNSEGNNFNGKKILLILLETVHIQYILICGCGHWWVWLTMRAICVLIGWCLSRCFLGGIMSVSSSLCGSMIQDTVLPVTSPNSIRLL